MAPPRGDPCAETEGPFGFAPPTISPLRNLLIASFVAAIALATSCGPSGTNLSGAWLGPITFSGGGASVTADGGVGIDDRDFSDGSKHIYGLTVGNLCLLGASKSSDTVIGLSGTSTDAVPSSFNVFCQSQGLSIASFQVTSGTVEITGNQARVAAVGVANCNSTSATPVDVTIAGLATK